MGSHTLAGGAQALIQSPRRSPSIFGFMSQQIMAIRVKQTLAIFSCEKEQNQPRFIA
jgi:hypothetical protein